jgi:hypothetical protein
LDILKCNNEIIDRAQMNEELIHKPKRNPKYGKAALALDTRPF